INFGSRADCGNNLSRLIARCDAELPLENLGALPEHLQRLRAVAHVRVQLHEPAVAAFTKWLEGERFVGVLERQRVLAHSRACDGEAVQCACQALAQLLTLVLYPWTFGSDQKRPAANRARHECPAISRPGFPALQQGFGAVNAVKSDLDIDPRA